MENYYTILGISEIASDEDIKKAYRRMAMKWHPDRNSNNKKAEEKFKEIKFAYETLSDFDKKKQYDYSLAENKKTKNNNSSNSNTDKNFNAFWNDNFSDIFNEKQEILNSEVSISFWDAVFGCKKTFPLELIKNGKKEKQTIIVTLPQGIQEHEKFLIDVNGLKINLYVHIESDSFFTRSNLDLFTNINIPFTLAALGGKINFPHWNGNIDVIIPPGVKPGQSILLSNLGIKRDIFIGDLYLLCNITVPKKLSSKQRELLQAFKETEKESNMFDSLKDSWKNFFKS